MEFLGLKIKLGHWIFEGLDFKQTNKYGIIILINENNIQTNSGIFQVEKLNQGIGFLKDQTLMNEILKKMINKYIRNNNNN